MIGNIIARGELMQLSINEYSIANGIAARLIFQKVQTKKSVLWYAKVCYLINTFPDNNNNNNNNNNIEGINTINLIQRSAKKYAMSRR